MCVLLKGFYTYVELVVAHSGHIKARGIHQFNDGQAFWGVLVVNGSTRLVIAPKRVTGVGKYRVGSSP